MLPICHICLLDMMKTGWNCIIRKETGCVSERVIRFLTFKQDKYAVEYSEKRRAKLSNKQEE